MICELDADEVAVSLACEVLDVSRSGYYTWLDRPISNREKENQELIERIYSIHEESDKTYGSPRITAELRSEGKNVSENRVARLMKKEGISSDVVKKFKIQTTDSNHNLPIAERLFETENADSVLAPNQVWTGDITYVAT
ncbi:MAG: IS3 family transposase, partial [Bacteroidetes bacterium]|nr:IS3 family transposase [Bacteroidota bacterium]